MLEEARPQVMVEGGQRGEHDKRPAGGVAHFAQRREARDDVATLPGGRVVLFDSAVAEGRLADEEGDEIARTDGSEEVDRRRPRGHDNAHDRPPHAPLLVGEG